MGEWGRLDLTGVSGKSVLSLAYLMTFGSVVGLSAYVWLLQVTTPAKVSTYAYVNPVVAVFLGWALAGEPVTGRTALAATVIILAVLMITTEKARGPQPGPRRQEVGEALRRDDLVLVPADTHPEVVREATHRPEVRHLDEDVADPPE